PGHVRTDHAGPQHGNWGPDRRTERRPDVGDLRPRVRAGAGRTRPVRDPGRTLERIGGPGGVSGPVDAPVFGWPHSPLRRTTARQHAQFDRVCVTMRPGANNLLATGVRGHEAVLPPVFGPAEFREGVSGGESGDEY